MSASQQGVDCASDDATKKSGFVSDLARAYSWLWLVDAVFGGGTQPANESADIYKMSEFVTHFGTYLISLISKSSRPNNRHGPCV